MSAKPWILSAVLAFVVVASMAVGGLVVSRIGDDPATRVAAGGGSSSPIASTIEAQSGGLADVVERSLDSTVVIKGGTAAGSGVVLDRDGHIITNYHVVEGQQSLKVVLRDGSSARATIVGTDASTDLAVLHADFDASQLSPATFGDSSALRAGDPVFAIGDPYDEPFTVTSGIISATGRSTQSSFTGRSIHDMIQTDAAVNPGNSGGPLFNLAGEVIGVNTSIENPNGRFFVGLGFAIPSNTVLRLAPRLVDGETVRHPQLGVSVVALDEVLAEDIGDLDVGRGLYVTAVTPSSAAERAGIVPAGTAQGRIGQAATPPAGGDVILSVAGQETKTFVDLARAIDRAEVGSTIPITVLRDGQRLELSATLQEWDLRTN